MPEAQNSRKTPYRVVIAIALALVTFAIYWPVRQFDYTNYDDQDYASENAHVQSGLTADGVHWAFTTGFASNWHPLTWLSLMLDVQLFGDNPAGHHFMNVVYHVLATIMLFLVLAAMTGAPGRSGFVAALFALHPLHVESVAWIAERKDVLSGLFWMLTMAAYVSYVRKQAALRYIWMCILYGLGLMAKPMLVTLPCALLLLDYWPLNRMRLPRFQSPAAVTPSSQRSFGTLALEKLPLFLLAVASSVITFIVQQKGGAVESLEKFPFAVRFANAFVAYVCYLGKTILPEDLAVLYPHPGHWPLWGVIGALLIVAIVSVLVLSLTRTHPYLLIGWLWFLGTLLPVIGLVQVGEQFMADRYSYIPLIGIFVILVWGACDLLGKIPQRQIALGAAATVALAVCIVGTYRQLRYWRNSITLFSHAVQVTPQNATAHYSVAQALSIHRFEKQALPHYEQALQIRPNYPDAHNNLGLTLALMGKFAEATNHYAAALRYGPSNIAAHVNYAIALINLRQPAAAQEHLEKALKLGSADALTYDTLGQAVLALGKADEAITHFRKALAIDPGFSEAHFHMAGALQRKGDLDGAIAELKQAAQISPGVPEIHSLLGLILAQQGKPTEAIEQYREALRINPNFIEALNNYAWLLATHPSAEIRNGKYAVEYAERACEATSYKVPMFIGTLAAAYAEAGQFDSAIEMAKKAEELAQAQNQNALAEKNHKLAEAYLNHTPYHEQH